MKHPYSAVFLFFIIATMAASCQSKMICPAFQSSFIYNQEERNKLFAYFDEDSLPVGDSYTNKNKYGIIKKVSKSKRARQMRTVEMEIVFSEKPADSALIALNDSTGVLMDLADSAGSDKNQYQNHYNVEQDNYMRLFGKYLPKPEPPLEKEEILEDLEVNDEGDADNESMTKKERRKAKREGKRRKKEESRKAKREMAGEDIDKDQTVEEGL